MTAMPQNSLVLGASAVMVLVTTLAGVVLLRAHDPLPDVREAGVLEVVSPGRAWSPLRALPAPDRGFTAANAALRVWLPKNAGQIDAQQFIEQFEARWSEILTHAPRGSERVLRDMLLRLYRQAGRAPKLISVLRDVQAYSARLHRVADLLGPTVGGVLRAKLAPYDQMMPWLAYAYAELGDPDKALSLARDTARRQPLNPEALFFYALAVIQQPDQTPEVLLTFRNLLNTALKLEPDFAILDLRPDQLRAEISQADVMLRNTPPPLSPRQAASNQVQTALKQANDHADSYLTPGQHIAFAARLTLRRVLRLARPAARYLQALWESLPPDLPPFLPPDLPPP